MRIGDRDRPRPLVVLGRVHVELTGARIEDVVRGGGFDALVSSDDTQLTMGGGVSKSILDAAGPSIRDEAARSTPLRIGDVAVTSAGALPARYILHAAALDLERGVQPTEATIRLLADNVFRRSESLRIQRLTIPAIGTGAGRFPPAHAARLTLSSLADHVRNPTVLRQVVFSLPSAQVHSLFAAEVAAVVSGKSTTPPAANLAMLDVIDGLGHRVLPLEKRLVSIGLSGDVEMWGSSVAGHHATITHEAGEYVLRDAGSTHGTFVNGEQISDKRLDNGDVVWLGDRAAEFVFLLPRRSGARGGARDFDHAETVSPIDSSSPGSTAGTVHDRREGLVQSAASGSIWDREGAPGTMGRTSLPGGSVLSRWFHRRDPVKLDLSVKTRPEDAETRATRSQEPWPETFGLGVLTRNHRPLVSGRYVLLEEIGRGGMGVVFLSWDVVLRHVVAIKTVSPGKLVSEEQSEALRREAALQIGLLHEGIVRLFHYEPRHHGTAPYIVMEYMPWLSGDRWLAEAGSSGLPLNAVLRVGIEVCRALAFAHAANVLHGDIKPSNIFVDPAGDRAKLCDFGVARVVGAGGHDALVVKLAGTPAYMAPEQKSFGSKVGPWTDIYLLAGTIAAFLGCKPDPHSGRPDLPADSSWMGPVTTVLRQALSDEPGRRPQSAQHFGTLLATALQNVA